MDKMLEKLGLYDFFVRMLTGLIVIVGALLFGMVDTTPLKDNGAVFTAAVLIAGYAIGVVLEEILYIISSILSRKKKDGMKRSKIIDENKRRKLIAAGYEGQIETPLIHAVMSGSCSIACALGAILFICKLTSKWDLTFGNELNDIVNLCILICLCVIFCFRYHHYLCRRHDLVERYYDAFCSEENSKTLKESDNTKDCT